MTDGARGRRWRRSRSAPPEAPPPPPPGPPARELDDLPGFFAAPPGSPRALTAGPAAADAPAGPAEGPAGRAPDPPEGTPAPRHRGPRRAALAAGAVVVVAGAVVAAAVLGRGEDPGPTAAGTSTTATPPPTTTATTARTTAAPLTAAAAGDLAGTDLEPGDDGFAAEVSFAGVVLEPRAVGVTVAYPRLRVSDDGDRGVAHVELEVWNCLADQPPADPAAADCRRGLTEYADLPSPDLRATRTADGVQLSGSFPTYTRPNGSAPVYTGRSYDLEVQLTGGRGPLTGTLRIGDGEATALPGGTLSG